jgi:hypothetical protein
MLLINLKMRMSHRNFFYMSCTQCGARYVVVHPVDRKYRTSKRPDSREKPQSLRSGSERVVYVVHVVHVEMNVLMAAYIGDDLVLVLRRRGVK